MSMRVASTRRTEADGRWPLAIAGALFLVAASGLALFHPDLFGAPAARLVASLGLATLLVGLVPLLAALAAWLAASLARRSPDRPRQPPRVAMIAFIASETMFFAAFFAAYLQYAISPETTAWPPAAMRPGDPWGGPLLNTFILLASGAAVAFAHDGFLRARRPMAIAGLAAAVLLAVIFLALQFREFQLANQSFTDGVYPSIFFLATGFHGLHVLIGGTLLAICLGRLVLASRASDDIALFDASAWYWHFVDAVWLLLFAVFYALGS